MALDASLKLLDASLQLAVGDLLAAVVDRLGPAAVDGDDAPGEQLHLPVQQHKRLAHLETRLVVVAPEVGNGLEGWCQPATGRCPKNAFQSMHP
jgi:hypothetical protein